jgi:hypothetical protein
LRPVSFTPAGGSTGKRYHPRSKEVQMKLTKMTLALALGAMLLAGPVAAQQGMPMPKPGPEHMVFKQDEGTWDAVVEMFMGPGAPPMTSKGVETNVLGCGSLCLISDFKGEMAPGQAFHGHGTTTWDGAKKKYVGSWTDSMSNGLAVSEGTYDAAAKTMTGYMEGPDASGKMARMKSVVEYKDANSRIFTMYMPGADGKEVPGMRITYTKRK